MSQKSSEQRCVNEVEIDGLRIEGPWLDKKT